jgi:hypothetical protein
LLSFDFLWLSFDFGLLAFDLMIPGTPNSTAAEYEQKNSATGNDAPKEGGGEGGSSAENKLELNSLPLDLESNPKRY